MQKEKFMKITLDGQQKYACNTRSRTPTYKQTFAVQQTVTWMMSA